MDKQTSFIDNLLYVVNSMLRYKEPGHDIGPYIHSFTGLDSPAPVSFGNDGTAWYRITIRQPDLEPLSFSFRLEYDRQVDRTEFDSMAEFEAWLDNITGTEPDESTDVT